ncbi:sensor histidine kinase [Paenibacillus psychroresistens]|uniref:histidine kinase n=2 Tax=Paenibacillus psychroresistens TaxID=1778678 RepID=A0A6B8RPR2_9BACL|nr:sensor histidine kinase [Paenibacillus psychroresistens]
MEVMKKGKRLELLRFFYPTGMTMQWKLIVVFIFLITIPIITTSYISYENYVRSIDNNTRKYVGESIVNMQSKLDDHVNDMQFISKIPLYSILMQQYLAENHMDLEIQRQMDFYIDLMNNVRKDLYTVYIFNNSGNVFYRLRTDSVRSDLMSHYKEWSTKAKEVSGDPVLISTQELPEGTGSSRYVFTLVRDIKDINTNISVGTVVVDGGLEVIENVVQEMNDVTKGKTLIVDPHNNVIYDSDKKLIARNIDGYEDLSKVVDKKGSFNTILDGEHYICNYIVSAKTGWKMLVYVPVYYLYKDAVLTRNVTLTATAGIIIFALFFSIVLSFTMTKPLRKLTKLMKQVRGGNLDVSFLVKFRDEVGVLGNEFNLMLRRIKELINEIYTISYRRKEAELEALQSQINPHFIYNTLETIRMRAEINDDDEVAEMTFTLGKLLRYSINLSREIVTLQDELNHLEHYVQLLRCRFSNRFELHYEIPEDLLSYQVMKLTFQPIVENAILHGVEGMEAIVQISFVARVEKNQIIFVIRDEGVGIDERRLQQLRDSLRGEASVGGAKSGVGLRNINQRIKLHYGEIYGIEIDSRPGLGTEVRLCLPYLKG